jgi:hypothetical protein
MSTMLRRTEEYAYYMLGLAKLETLKATLVSRNLKFVNFFDDKFKIKWVRRTDLEIREVFIRIACVMHGLSKQNRTEIHNPCGWLTKGVTDFDRHGVRCDDLQIIEEFNDVIPPFGDDKIGKAVVIKILPTGATNSTPGGATNNNVVADVAPLVPEPSVQLDMKDFPELGAPPPPPPVATVDVEDTAASCPPPASYPTLGASPLRHCATASNIPRAPQAQAAVEAQAVSTNAESLAFGNICAPSSCAILQELRSISSIMRQLLLKVECAGTGDGAGECAGESCDTVYNAQCDANRDAVCKVVCTPADCTPAVCTPAVCTPAVCTPADCTPADCEAESIAKCDVERAVAAM